MGRIKTTMIKRTANTLIKNYPDKFTQDFEANKKLVEEFSEIQSKKLRNIIAGYLARLAKKQEVAA